MIRPSATRDAIGVLRDRDGRSRPPARWCPRKLADVRDLHERRRRFSRTCETAARHPTPHRYLPRRRQQGRPGAAPTMTPARSGSARPARLPGSRPAHATATLELMERSRDRLTLHEKRSETGGQDSTPRLRPATLWLVVYDRGKRNHYRQPHEPDSPWRPDSLHDPFVLLPRESRRTASTSNACRRPESSL